MVQSFQNRLLFAFCSLGIAIRGSVALSMSAKVMTNTPLLEGLKDELIKDFPAEPTEAIEGALASALASAAAAEGISFSDVSCVRDYSLACPSGWIDLGDGATCKAPTGYGGSCPLKVSYGSLSPIEKSALASKCSAVFPCLGGPVAAGYRRAKSDILAIARGNRTCVVDDDAVCPIGWPALGGGLCVAPRRYEGACARAYDFSKFSAAAKQVHAELCNAPWPCAKRLAESVWSRSSVNLRSSGGEEESVRHLMDASKLFDAASSQQDTAEEKALRAELVSAMSSPAQFGTPDHQIPASAKEPCVADVEKCPVGWQREGATCEAGSSYAGPCASSMDLSVLTEDEKLAYAHVCQVAFPCV